MTSTYDDVFLQEAEELLGGLEEALMELEDRPGDLELVARVFRAMHTIKGSGAMFGFDDVSAFTHEVETVFDRVRQGEVPVNRALVDISLAAKDHIRGLIQGTANPEDGAPLLARLREAVGNDAPAPAGDADDVPAETATSGERATYRIRFRPAPDLFARGTDPVLLVDELAQLGPSRVVAQTRDLPSLDALDPEACYVYWDVVLTTDRGENAIRDVFIFVEDECDLTVQVIDRDGVFDNDAEYKRLGDILVERGDITEDDLQTAISAQKRVGELLVDQGLVTPEQVSSALAEQATVRENRKARASAGESTSVRVSAEKLDKMVDLVGELVIAQARLGEMAGRRQDPELLTIAEELDRLTSELRDSTLDARMLPIGTTFSRFRRLVRDLSGELGREVVLETEGADTELDKTVIERLNDPLVHLIRNAIDHGIEPPDEREAAGKPRQGIVRLAAVHSGAHVIVQISDDGRGLDAAAIKAKGVERGLLSPDAEPSEKELFNLIFAAGFSTAKNVSSVSGRGVGMDVVRRSIETLRGTVDLSSEPGRGSTVTIKLPLTLAIIEGLLVEVGGDRYVMPLSLVEECIELSRREAELARGRRLTPVRGELVPYLRLREWFHATGERPELEQIVIARVDDDRMGFVVDRVIGQHQTVIKSLGKVYQGVEGLSGATILGDGAVALILDLPRLAQNAVDGSERRREAARPGPAPGEVGADQPGPFDVGAGQRDAGTAPF